MRKRELRRRLKRMKRYLSTNTVQSWAKTFIDSLQQPIPGTPHITRSLNKRLSKLLVKDYLSARKRLLLLDYDGTLVPFSTSYDKVKPSEKLIQTLGLLAEDKNNDIVLISGRDQSELEDWFSNLPISLVSEHGAAIKKNGGKWHSIEKAEPSWKKLLLPVLQKYADLTPGAKVEVKPHSLVWHYRAASNYYAQKYSVIIKRSLKPILKKEGLELLQGNKVLEIKNPKVSKGVAAKNWLNNDYDFIMAIGDDNTDEELFSELPLSTYSIKVGRGLSLAKYRLHSYKDVTELLRRLSR
jgi:trehalose 6-phosphate synthase/phosphatase